METRPVQDPEATGTLGFPPVGTPKTLAACVGAAIVPGLGHALLGKWDRAAVFFCSIGLMVTIGIWFDGRLWSPDFDGIVAALKFVAEAGAGVFYWIPWLQGAGIGDPTAYTYDYANVFLYVAGLLNMLVIVDVFDIAKGRKP
ncbi:MAG: hypothetical protein QM330_12605 [Acidobacteriota bacterium]|jgi:hypothetical protein|nr:hypothetical protein [Acidobacteriota bacterium]NLT33958.1 hypothetical protein [Acidobacteriota bacterium]